MTPATSSKRPKAKPKEEKKGPPKDDKSDSVEEAYRPFEGGRHRFEGGGRDEPRSKTQNNAGSDSGSSAGSYGLEDSAGEADAQGNDLKKSQKPDNGTMKSQKASVDNDAGQKQKSQKSSKKSKNPGGAKATAPKKDSEGRPLRVYQGISEDSSDGEHKSAAKAKSKQNASMMES